MKELRGGEYVIGITRDATSDIVEVFKKHHEPKELTQKVKKLKINKEIKRDQVKDYVKQHKSVNPNLKTVYSLVYRNSTEGVQTMMKANKEYKQNQRFLIANGC